MASVKTAISIQESLFEQVDHLARELDISRSRLFVMAAEDFIQRHRNRQLLAEINQAYDDMSTVDEQAYLDKTRQQHRKMVSSEW